MSEYEATFKQRRPFLTTRRAQEENDRLRAENAVLREALVTIANLHPAEHGHPAIARAALAAADQPKGECPTCGSQDPYYGPGCFDGWHGQADQPKGGME